MSALRETYGHSSYIFFISFRSFCISYWSIKDYDVAWQAMNIVFVSCDCQLRWPVTVAFCHTQFLRIRWLEVAEILDSPQRAEVGEDVARFGAFVGVALGEEDVQEAGVVARHLVTLPLNAKMTVLNLQSGLRGLIFVMKSMKNSGLQECRREEEERGGSSTCIL